MSEAAEEFTFVLKKKWFAGIKTPE
jgi:hypothetical protein